MPDYEIPPAIIKDLEECGISIEETDNKIELKKLASEVVNGLDYAFRDATHSVSSVLQELNLVSDIYSKQADNLSPERLELLRTLSKEGIVDGREVVKELKTLTKALEKFIDGVEVLTTKAK